MPTNEAESSDPISDVTVSMRGPEVRVCVATFRRPKGLRRLLIALDALEFQGEPPNLTIVVVDNDSESSASDICRETAQFVRWPIQYVVEKRRGISPARNLALATALPGADWIAFIDDDEAPLPSWLSELLRVQLQYQADVVGGPVRSVYESGVPPWMQAAGFFNARRHPTGTQLGHAFTNNVLFRASILSGMDRWFDDRLALTGGEDSHFFRRVAALGHKIVWANDAQVEEYVPTTRATSQWLFTRALRTGTTMTFIDRDLGAGWWTAPLILAKAVVWLAIGSLEYVVGVASGRVRRMIATHRIAFALGRIMGLFGGKVEEYRTVHGG